MPGLNITNTETTPVLSSLDIPKVEAIQRFNTNLLENGSVSKEDVLALEEFVGFSLITSKISPNRYTMVRSHNMWDETVEFMEGVLPELPSTEVTLPATLELAQHIMYDIREFEAALKAILERNVEDYDMLTNTIHSTVWWSDKLVDLAEVDIKQVISTEDKYLKAAMDESTIEYLRDAVKEDHIFTLLISMITNNLDNIGFVPKLDIIEKVTFSNILKKVYKTPVLNQVASLYRTIQELYKDLLNYDDNYHELLVAHKRLSMLDNLLDKESTLVLRAISRVNTNNKH